MAGPAPASGTRRVLARVWSPQLENERDIDIFLPPSYARTRRRYPVVYMQDGQNLADPERAFAGTWELTRALDDLAARGLEAIVVGVPNIGAERLREYSPFPDAAPRRRRRRRVPRVHRADAEAADRSPGPHPAGA